MACSARIRVRSSYTRADGTNQVYLQVIISRVVKWLPLDLHWPAKFFDEAAGRALPRRRGDKEADDVNLQAGQELSRVTKIFVEWRLREQDLTMPEFPKEFNSKLNRDNFCDYFATKLGERWSSEEITDLSYKTQRATLRKPQEFAPDLPFANLKSWQFAKKFDLWLEKKKGSGPNTRWARHKDVKTYLHLAEKDNIRFDWSFVDGFPNRQNAPENTDFRGRFLIPFCELLSVTNCFLAALRPASVSLHLLFSSLRPLEQLRPVANFLPTLQPYLLPPNSTFSYSPPFHHETFPTLL